MGERSDWRVGGGLKGIQRNCRSNNYTKVNKVFCTRARGYKESKFSQDLISSDVSDVTSARAPETVIPPSDPRPFRLPNRWSRWGFIEKDHDPSMREADERGGSGSCVELFNHGTAGI
jgi:hypothetical protein